MDPLVFMRTSLADGNVTKKKKKKLCMLPEILNLGNVISYIFPPATCSPEQKFTSLIQIFVSISG